jgi:cell division protein FtsI/penicillin-binding protein 2
MSDRVTHIRVTLILALVVFVTGLFLFKLFSYQVIDHKQYAEAARQQSTSTDTEQAQRGAILAKDKDGKLYTLAASEQRYQLLVVPRQVKNKQKLAELIAQENLGLKKEEVFEKINNDKVYIPPLIGDLTPAQADTLLKKNYVGVYVRPQFVRVYPEGSTIAPQLLGFVGSDGQGKYGIEATQDSVLRGVAGSKMAKKDSLGRLIDILGAKRSEPGADVVLTIDYNLQFTVESKLKEAIERFKAEGGSIVVLDPKTGAILAMAGYPTFDPNFFNKVAGEAQRSFLPAGVSFPYEPGSVMKPITMAMAIEMGLVEPNTTEVFGGSVRVGGFEIRNAENKVYGKETMTQVLENSDNVAMVWLSQKIGKEKQREFLEKFGFGTKTGVELVGEQPGVIRDKKEWNETLSATAAYGQGISVTPLQLAAAYAVIANNGVTVTPHLVAQTIRGANVMTYDQKAGNRVISEATAKKIREMLVSVVEFGHGKRAKVEGIKVGGKTGTAQVADPRGGYAEDRHIGSFAGLFPADDPKFVMVVRLDNPKTVRFAESSAAPIFGEIANWMTNYYKLR